MIKIVGYQGVSLIDFPGRIATVLFTPGCNFLCPYCQNPELVFPSKTLEPASSKDIYALLSDRKNFIDGVSITGGEPTLLNDLPEFLKSVKEMNLATKVDTNGYKPGVVERLINEELVDFVAMDIKSSLDKYEKAAGKLIDVTRIKRTVDIILASDIEYEFRTTVAPGFVDKEDVISIARMIKGAKSFRLQQFSNKVTLDEKLKTTGPYLPDKLKEMAEAAREFVANVQVRGI